MMRKYIERMKGKDVSPRRKPVPEIVWSWVGSFLGIFLIAYVGEMLAFREREVLFLIGSFGASAVLVYGAPKAELAQPRNLVGGHLFSAITGVAVSSLCPDNIPLAGALAVSCSIALMHATRTLHPPGGATALIAVIGGEKVQSLGFWYVLCPVLVGALLMLLVALAVNNLSSDSTRHYPVYWL